MTTVRTDLRNTQESAQKLRSQSFGAITATNVQNALKEIATTPQAFSTKSIAFADSPYAVTNLDIILLVDTSGGAVTINLQAGALRNGRPLSIKDNTGNAAANPISLVPNGAETVDGLAPFPLDSNFAAVRLGPKAAGGYFVDA